MTDAQIIYALGGCARVAALLGEERTCVTNWIHPTRGIPSRARLAVYRLATNRGLHLHANDFLRLPPGVTIVATNRRKAEKEMA